MATLVEVKVLDYNIVLACEETSTVSEVTASAVAEVQSFNLKNFPRKVLHTRDGDGRILSGALQFIKSGLSPKLHVIVAEYNNNDTLKPEDTLSLYRDWQYWTICQVQESIKALSIHDVPPFPETVTTSLLYELCKVPVEKVQLMAARALQILLTKFSQREVIIEAAEHISKLFITTEFANVAVAALECFKGLSPLQAKVFNGAKYIREMYNVQRALARFPEDKQGMIFDAFKTISSILGDRELLRVVGADTQLTDAQESESNSAGLRLGSFVEAVPSDQDQAVEVRDQTIDNPNEGVPPPPQASHIPTSEKRINLRRLESLLSSDDRQVRQYSLQKLLKLLTLSAKAHTSEAAGDRSASVSPELTSTSEWDSIGRDREGCFEREGRDSESSLHPASAYKFSFSDGQEVDSLVKCLFRCLKQCIHARPKASTAGAGAGAGAEGSNELVGGDEGSGRCRSSPERAARLVAKKGSDKVKAISATSTAGRLIQNALSSPQTDEASVLLIVDCLWQVVHFPQDVAQNSRFPLGLAQKSRKRLKLDNSTPSNIQLVFMQAAREWYRLLLTLAHADEGSKLLRYADLAEKAAYFFILVVLHGMDGAWSEAEVSLDTSAICSFLIFSQPTFRAYLALTYLSSLAANCFPDSNESSSSSAGAGPSAEARTRNQLRKYRDGNNGFSDSSAEQRALQDILLCRNFEVSGHLWRWATSQERARKCSLMSLTCLSSFCAFSEFTAFMYRLDPITRLASMLQVAVRDEKAESLEYGGLGTFGPGWEHPSSAASNSSAADSDWDAPRDQCRIPVVMPADEAQEEARERAKDEAERGLMLDDAFGAADSPSIYQQQHGLSMAPVADAADATDAEGGIAGVPKLSALDRMMSRQNQVMGAVIDKQQRQLQQEEKGENSGSALSPATFVYPDVPLIRLLLKMMWNLLSASRSSGVYKEDYRAEVSNWLRGVEVGPQSIGEHRTTIKLSRIVRRDEVIKFYYNLLTQSQHE